MHLSLSHTHATYMYIHVVYTCNNARQSTQSGHKFQRKKVEWDSNPAYMAGALPNIPVHVYVTYMYTHMCMGYCST